MLQVETSKDFSSQRLYTSKYNNPLTTSNGSVNNGQVIPVNEFNGQTKLSKQKNMTLSTINPLILTFKAMEYAARGPVIMRAIEIEKELAQGIVKPFKEIFKANLGDAQAMGQPPITFLRQVLALVSQPELITRSSFPEDVKRKAVEILSQCRGKSAGSYTDSRGLEIVRRHVAEYITTRDEGIRSSADDIILFAGASDGIRACLKLLKQSEAKDGGRKAGVMVPIPEYPLYNATLGEYNMTQIGYYLENTQDGWTINVDELKRAVKESRGNCVPKAIVIINPGNPTGNVLSMKSLQDIIKFAYDENLVIFADEVYQENVYSGMKFVSAKKALMEMNLPYNSMELFSFYSCSKGYVCECGLRGAYVEMVNLDPAVKSVLIASIAAKLCPSVLGQAAVDCSVNPPKAGDESYPLFVKEKNSILNSLEEKSKLIVNAFSSLPGIKCSPVQGAMYVYPEINLTEKFIRKAREDNLEPDVFYALQLLEATGICVVPGSGIGQYPGTFHFRTTVLLPRNQVLEMLEKFSKFHLLVLEQYS